MQGLPGFRRRIFTIAAPVFAVGLFMLGGYSPTAFASGAPPSHVHPAPSGGVDTLHADKPGLAHGVKRVKKGDRLPNGQIALNSGV